MAPQSKGKSSKTVIDRPGSTNWRETSLEGSLILSIVKEAAAFAPIEELKNAACSALLIFKTTQVWTRKNNGLTCLKLSSLFIGSKGKQRGIQTTWLRFERAHHCHLALV
jgi:hypothetical protein